MEKPSQPNDSFTGIRWMVILANHTTYPEGAVVPVIFKEGKIVDPPLIPEKYEINGRAVTWSCGSIDLEEVRQVMATVKEGDPARLYSLLFTCQDTANVFALGLLLGKDIVRRS